MAAINNPFFNACASGNFNAVPWWTLLQSVSIPTESRHGFSHQRHHQGAPGTSNEPKPCSSRQSSRCGTNNTTDTSTTQSFNPAEFFANAAAIVKVLLEDDQATASAGNTGTCCKSKPTETLSAKHTADSYEVSLDVSQFKPEDLNVKTVENTIVIEGKHEEAKDAHGSISRSFIRKYVLPEGVKPENVVCKFSTNGILTLSATIITPKNERSIPINITGQPATVEAVPEVYASNGSTDGQQAPSKVDSAPSGDVPITMESEDTTNLD